MTYTCSKCGKSYIESILLPVKQSFANTSWSDINIISESGVASEYFNIGDEKELTIGSETYHVQILGFNHDDKSDGTGKAGITVSLKEIMTNIHYMNPTNTNVGGWEASEMRTYVNGDVYNNLPQEVKDTIKPVDKLTSEGNKSINIVTTSDKLFLLSEVEIFGSTTYSVSGEGSQYQFFKNGGSKKRYYLTGSSYSYWERSPRIGYTNYFCSVNGSGETAYGGAFSDYCVTFGFCI